MKTKTSRSRKAAKPTASKAARTRRSRAKPGRARGKAGGAKALKRNPRRGPSARQSGRPGEAFRGRPLPEPAALPKSPLGIPPILLEGDEPPRPAPTALTATPAAAAPVPESASLPESYGTGKLSLLPRDPHWLYAYWDLPTEQQRRFNALSAERHLVVRVQPGTLAGHPSTDVHVHPESRSWFIHVENAATRYTAELGYYPASGEWVPVARSVSAVTPPDTISRDKTLRFATLPPEAIAREHVVPARLPQPAGALPPGPGPDAAVDGQAPGPSEAADLLRSRVLAALAPSSLALAAPAGAAPGISSPPGGQAAPPKGFWLNVNAEVVLYGGTEPDARVTIDGKPIELRDDGTFSFRFALPDGEYHLHVSAQSTGGDLRSADLRFARRSGYAGEVGAAPQDPLLKTPAAENL
ncbi:MAG TPA: DUF4912 domain-containing protein [Candidatus Acidoferrum sp.]|nr:DUF4912 domain-containing protein [Candidatus Acidoferrum sp.]